MGMIIPNMGTIEHGGGLADALFSKTQRQVLGLLFGNPGRSFYANEVVRHAGVGIGTVQRELTKLAAAGLLTVTERGNQKHYQANRDAPIFDELRGIVLKTFGVADVLREALAPLGEKIQVAFIYGSVAKGSDTADSDIDLMLIGQGLSYPDVVGVLSEPEARLGRAVNPTIYKPEEFRGKLEEKNAFLSRVVAQEKIFIRGSKDDIPEPGESG